MVKAGGSYVRRASSRFCVGLTRIDARCQTPGFIINEGVAMTPRFTGDRT